MSYLGGESADRGRRPVAGGRRGRRRPLRQEMEPRAPAGQGVLQAVKAEITRVVVGQERLIERLLIALLCNGHVLIEGVPGLAKTLTVTTLARTVRAGFQRIQFTPDLLPADLTGTLIYNPKTQEFVPRQGPIFTNIVLADEINRAPAKVQSALLEAMQERQVTIGDTTYPLDDPFMVLATQNPIEQEGTYPLPEAQTDRFMLKLAVTYPSQEEELEILRRMARNQPPPRAEAVIGPEQIRALREEVDQVYIDPKIEEYIVNLVDASRHPQRRGLPLAELHPVRGLAPGHHLPDPHLQGPRPALRPRLRDAPGREVPGPGRAAPPHPAVLRGRGPGLELRHHRGAHPGRGGGAVTTTELARAVRFLEITTRKAVTATFAGRYTSAFKGRGMEFDEVREYQSGDDVRSIDWNVSARTGRLHTKRYVEERELTILLLVDLSASGSFGSTTRSKAEVAAEICALLAFTAIRSNDRVGLIIFTDRVQKVIAPRKGSRHVLRLIRDILAFAPDRDGERTSINAGLQALSAVLKRRAVVFLVSDFQDRGYEALLKTAGRRHDLIAVLLADPRELRPARTWA